MAANYKVNIELDTSKLDAQLKDLGVKVDAVGKTRAGTSRKVLTEEEKIKREQEKQLNESIKILQAKNATASSTNKALRLERKGAQTKEEIKRLTEIEQDLNAQNLKSQKIEKLNADYQLKLQQREIEGQKKETVVAKKNVKVEDTGRKILKEKVKLLGQAVKLRQIGSRFGALGADLDALTAPITRGPGGKMLALPSSEMLANRVSATGQRGGFAGSSGGGGFAGMGRMFGSMFSGFNKGAALSSATISGAFPLLFGQGPVSALGGAIGGGLGGGFGGQMGGFAGGLAGTTIATGIAAAVKSVKDLSAALNPLKFNADAAIEALGFLNSERAREISLIEKTKGATAALLEIQKDIAERYGPGAVSSLRDFDRGWDDFMKGFKSSITDMKIGFAEFVDSITSDTKQMRDLGLKSLGKENPLVKQYKDLTKQIQEAQTFSPEKLNTGEFRQTGFWGSGTPELTRQGKENVANLKAERDKLTPGLIAGGIDADANRTISEYNAKFTEQIGLQEYNLDIQKRIHDLRANGINPAIAKTMVKLEEMNDITIEILNNELAMKQAKINEGDLEGKELVLAQQAVGVLEEKIKKQKELNQAKIDEIEKAMEANIRGEKALQLYKDIGSTIKGGMLEGINAVIDGTKTLGDVASNVLRQISNKLISFGLDTLLGGIPGIGGMFKAEGGPVKGGSSYIVGERGPELFVPGSSGNIVPNHKLGRGGGSASIVVNVDASGSSVEGEEEESRELGSMLAAAIQTELVRQQRPGGLLA